MTTPIERLTSVAQLALSVDDFRTLLELVTNARTLAQWYGKQWAEGSSHESKAAWAILRGTPAACTCYDDGIMCVTPRDCPTHGHKRASQPSKGSE